MSLQRLAEVSAKNHRILGGLRPFPTNPATLHSRGDL